MGSGRGCRVRLKDIHERTKDMSHMSRRVTKRVGAEDWVRMAFFCVDEPDSCIAELFEVSMSILKGFGMENSRVSRHFAWVLTYDKEPTECCSAPMTRRKP